MAERRMFALKIVDSDAFLDMPDSAQNLYFHLAMRADDDGFISNPRKVMRMIGANEDNLKILLAKRFLLTFDTGIVVIKHWRLHNYIAKDRYTETIYKEEKDKLFVKANGAYTDHPELVSIPCTVCIQDDDTGKVRLDKVSEEKIKKTDGDCKKEEKHKHGTFQNVLLTDSEKTRLTTDFHSLADKAIQYLSEYKVEKGYVTKSDNLTIRRWVIDAVRKREGVTAIKQKTSTQTKKRMCPKCGGDIIGSACVVCFSNFNDKGEEI